MAKQEKVDRHLRCSFCGKSRDEVRKLIAGPTVYICDECVNLCNDIIAEDWEEAKEEISSKLKKPADIKHHLDQYVIGQERAKRALGPDRVERLGQERQERGAEQRADGVRDQPRDDLGAHVLMERHERGRGRQTAHAAEHRKSEDGQPDHASYSSGGPEARGLVPSLL